MNYRKHYNLLITAAKYRILEGYTETHHIIPKCMGGTDEFDNLVNLTPEEHYLAHQLLVKIYPDNRKLLFSARMMTISPIGKRTKNKMYGWLKRRMSDLGHSNETKEKIGKSHLGKKRSDDVKIKMSLLQKERGGYGPKIFSEEHKLKISVANTGKIHPPRTTEHKGNLSKSLKGKIATAGFTNRSHSEESKIKSRETHLSKNLEPWETWPILSNKECLILWEKLDIVYDAWIETECSGYKRVCSHLKMKIKSSVENMIIWFKKNGNPANHAAWLIFKGKLK